MRSGWGGWFLGFPTFQLSDLLASWHADFLVLLVLWRGLVEGSPPLLGAGKRDSERKQGGGSDAGEKEQVHFWFTPG